MANETDARDVIQSMMEEDTDSQKSTDRMLGQIVLIGNSLDSIESSNSIGCKAEIAKAVVRARSHVAIIERG